MEVIGSQVACSNEILNSIVNRIVLKQGLNDQGDVSIPWLKVVDKTVWENMQKVA